MYFHSLQNKHNYRYVERTCTLYVVCFGIFNPQCWHRANFKINNSTWSRSVCSKIVHFSLAFLPGFKYILFKKFNKNSYAVLKPYPNKFIWPDNLCMIILSYYKEKAVGAMTAKVESKLV